MATPQGTVRMCQQGSAITFRVEGRATLNHSLPLRRQAEQSLAAGVTALRIDLRRCAYMDSTFLGTLLFFKRMIDRRGQGEFALVSPSPQCCELLRQMKLDEVYPIVMVEEPAAETWMDLESSPEDTDIFRQNIVQAHQELADLPGPAGEVFRPVARCLVQDQEASRGRSG